MKQMSRIWTKTELGHIFKDPLVFVLGCVCKNWKVKWKTLILQCVLTFQTFSVLLKKDSCDCLKMWSAVLSSYWTNRRCRSLGSPLVWMEDGVTLCHWANPKEQKPFIIKLCVCSASHGSVRHTLGEHESRANTAPSVTNWRKKHFVFNCFHHFA